jgi:D-galactose 1-dehydrogenase
VNAPLRLGLVGFGKIAHAQHLPAADDAFELVAVVEPNGTDGPLPCYGDVGAMLAAQPSIDAMIMCQPPQCRYTAARDALLAQRHVFLEKPPGATLSEVEALAELAATGGLTLFAGWHSREAAAVSEAKRRLGQSSIHSANISWKEDIHVWHPGQRWIAQAGGFGVFDPGINALSILTLILPEPVRMVAAELFVPTNWTMPIAANLELQTASGSVIAAEFDFRQQGPQTWDIRIDSDAGVLCLSEGGNALQVDGECQPVETEQEYSRLYRRFLELVRSGGSEVDLAPMRLIADALLSGRRIAVDPFDP